VVNCVTPLQFIENAYLAWADGRTLSFNRAPIENVPISVLCHVSINFVVKVSYSSQPILVSVRKQ